MIRLQGAVKMSPTKTVISEKRLNISIRNFLLLFVRVMCIFLKISVDLCRNGKT